MPALSASTPFLPNLNQHVVLEPLEGPSLLGRIRSFKFRVPRNREESCSGEEEWLMGLVEKSEGAHEKEMEEQEAIAVLSLDDSVVLLSTHFLPSYLNE